MTLEEYIKELKILCINSIESSTVIPIEKKVNFKKKIEECTVNEFQGIMKEAFLYRIKSFIGNEQFCICQILAEILVKINERGAVTETELAGYIADLKSTECDKEAIAKVIMTLLTKRDDVYFLNQLGEAKLQQCMEGPAQSYLR